MTTPPCYSPAVRRVENGIQQTHRMAINCRSMGAICKYTIGFADDRCISIRDHSVGNWRSTFVDDPDCDISHTFFAGVPLVDAEGSHAVPENFPFFSDDFELGFAGAAH